MKLLKCLFIGCFLTSCDSPEHSQDRVHELLHTSKVMDQVSKNAQHSGIKPVVTVDHSRLAEDEGAVLHANVVSLFSNPKVNTMILKNQIRAGLDLPYRVQAYYDHSDYHTSFTNPEFLEARHGVNDLEALALMRDDLLKLTAQLPNLRSVKGSRIGPNYGIVELSSNFDFQSTISKLKEAILAEGDTVWFSDIDFQAEAKEIEVELPKVHLLIFGGPAPGAKAMYDFPAMGLDVFPQKVLVYEDASDKICVIYNDIPAMAEFHHADAAVPHQFIAYRLKSTLSKAVEK